MTAAVAKFNSVHDRIIFAGIDGKACICFDGEGITRDQMDPETGKMSALFLEQQIGGRRGFTQTLRAFDLNYYQAQELLICLATITGHVVEILSFTEKEEREFALNPNFTFRSRDLNMTQVLALLCRYVKLRQISY